VRRIELYVDGELAATLLGNSLSYRWDTRGAAGPHSFYVLAYGGGAGAIGSATSAITVR
jgi:hypothetical protein